MVQGVKAQERTKITRLQHHAGDSTQHGKRGEKNKRNKGKVVGAKQASKKKNEGEH